MSLSTSAVSTRAYPKVLGNKLPCPTSPGPCLSSRGHRFLPTCRNSPMLLPKVSYLPHAPPTARPPCLGLTTPRSSVLYVYFLPPGPDARLERAWPLTGTSCTHCPVAGALLKQPKGKDGGGEPAARSLAQARACVLLASPALPGAILKSFLTAAPTPQPVICHFPSRFTRLGRKEVPLLCTLPFTPRAWEAPSLSVPGHTARHTSPSLVSSK